MGGGWKMGSQVPPALRPNFLPVLLGFGHRSVEAWGLAPAPTRPEQCGPCAASNQHAQLRAGH